LTKERAVLLQIYSWKLFLAYPELFEPKGKYKAITFVGNKLVQSKKYCSSDKKKMACSREDESLLYFIIDDHNERKMTSSIPF
jgi:hypothetical protein